MKESKEHFIKTTATMLIVLVCTLSFVAGNVIAQGGYDATVSYNLTECMVTIRGMAPSNSRVSVFILSGDEDVQALSDESLPQDTAMAISVNGRFETSIKLSTSYDGGEFIAYLFGDEGMDAVPFMYVNLEMAGAVVPIVNQAIEQGKSAAEILNILESNSTALSISQEVRDKYLNNAAVLLQSSTVTYSDTISFLNNFNEAVACAMINAGEPAEALNKYETDIGINYTEEYDSLDDEVKDRLNTLLIAYDYRKEFVGAAYPKLVCLAMTQTADRWSRLMDIVMDNKELLELDLTNSKYLSIKNKDMIFKEMYLLTNTKFEDIEPNFLKAIDAAYLLENPTVKQNNNGGSSSSGGSSGGGGGGSVVMTIDSTLVSIPTSTVEPSQTDQEEPKTDPEEVQEIYFSDIENHWAKEQIENFKRRGIIDGFPDGSFKPDQPVTRAQFAKIFSNSQGITPVETTENFFKDVSPEDSLSPYVYAIYNMGIINGVGDDEFAPNEEIKREDACLIIYRYLSESLLEKAEITFLDEENISTYARDAVFSLSTAGVIQGSDSRFNPLGKITRAETVTLLGKIID